MFVSTCLAVVEGQILLETLALHTLLTFSVLIEHLKLVDKRLGHGSNGSHDIRGDRDINLIHILDDWVVLLVVNTVQWLNDH